MVAVVALLVLLLAVAHRPCRASFTSGSRPVPCRGRSAGLSFKNKKNRAPTKRRGCSPLDPTATLRGGGDGSLHAVAAADYSGAARVLFGNFIGPSAMLSGGLVPLGFIAKPLPGDNSLQKKLRGMYHLLTIFSLSNELMAIVYAVIASNKLALTTLAPAASVFDLIQRELELPWIATNVHSMFGLMGFLAMMCLRAYTIFPKKYNVAAAGIAGTSLMSMLSIINRSVSGGDGKQVFGTSVFSLFARYMVLLVKQVKNEGGFMAAAAIALGIFSTVLVIREIFASEPH